MESPYSPRLRTERLIIASRVALVAFSLLAVILDPFGPPQAAILTNKIIAAYLGYSLLLAPLLGILPLHVEKIGFITHTVDVLFFTGLMFVTEGFASPFFTFFIFTLFCGALRWQKQGALWTALVFLCLFIGLGTSMEIVRSDRDPELNRFMIRSAHLAIIALLLVYLTAYEKVMRKELGRLADWPSKINTSQQPEVFIHNILANASLIMDAPRTLMIWEEQEEPARHIAYLSSGGLIWRQTSPDCFDPLVATPLNNLHFLCKNAADPEVKVLHTAVQGLKYWSGLPLHPDLIQRYAIDRVIGLYLNGEKFQGRILFMDKSEMISDDLTLGVLVARQTAALMDQFISHLDLQKAAALEERIKMARDLHDGLLQTLTGIALQIETIRRLLDQDTQVARKQLGELQGVIVEEQRGLRHFIEKLKPPAVDRENGQQTLAERLNKLAATVQRQWGLKVSISLPPPETPQELPDDIYPLVRESLINCARHARATEAQATVGIEAGRVHICVSDNGRGFPFQGRYDLAELTAMQTGPRSLIERIAALQGQLSIDSGAAGATIKMSVPLRPCKQPIGLSPDSNAVDLSREKPSTEGEGWVTTARTQEVGQCKEQLPRGNQSGQHL